MDDFSWYKLAVVQEIKLVVGGDIGIHILALILYKVFNFNLFPLTQMSMLLGFIWLGISFFYELDNHHEFPTREMYLQSSLIRIITNIIVFVTGLLIHSEMSKTFFNSYPHIKPDYPKLAVVNVEDPCISILISFIGVLEIMSLIRSTIMALVFIGVIK